MYNILGLPEQYKVNKKLGKNRYLQHGNLTAAERKNLEIWVKNIELLYAIPCCDGSEMIVLSVEPDLPDINLRFYLLNVVKAIAQSFPYQCMVVLRCQGIVKFIIFDEHFNTINTNRSVVDCCYATPDFTLAENGCELHSFVEELHVGLNHLSSAQELHGVWKQTIIMQAGNKEIACMLANSDSRSLFSSAKYALEIQKAETTLESRWDDVLDGEFNDYYDQYENNDNDVYFYEDEWQKLACEFDHPQKQSNLFDGLALSFDNSEEDLFIDFCSAHCWVLYNEAAASYYEDVIPRVWLEDYLDACNCCAVDYFGRSIDTSDAYRIRTAFENQETPTNGYYGSFNVDELKSHLWRYFDE